MSTQIDKTATTTKPAIGRSRADEIRTFILAEVHAHPNDIAHAVSERFGITRQAANKHLKTLVKDGVLEGTGTTRSRKYRLRQLLKWSNQYVLNPGLEEDRVWSSDIRQHLEGLPRNVLDIWHYCFTEMFNNAIDHSEAKLIDVTIEATATTTELEIWDNGIGIFQKIKDTLQLFDERQAILELSKGKLTTDPERHTGQGVFFTSRMVDSFQILSGGYFFSHEIAEQKDWVLEREKEARGTLVIMRIANSSERTAKAVFDQFSSGSDYGFTRTIIPVMLAQYGDERLISRSQAKRLMARVDLFSEVLLNFSGVASIGQAFADEIFRVYARSHPEIELIPTNANPAVQQIIHAARMQP